ncbi:glycosyltransferase 87 family protein [Streptomyces albidus (ex Kaewkla and Franco 2022)]|uniref:glycosyltransferase 87 family protein n=1 Tax=Streptomyces albidus (ex Kaewkla and Franco 2022) TaxID=722709 RepID=UPI0015EEF9E7|nr:glycosyltransferase 87 family protein [Streptomyces albidus (ex Kaewkla and Franco 2022)]
MTATTPVNRAEPGAARASWTRKGRWWEPVGLALCAAMALLLAVSSPPRVPQQIWGVCAALAYGAAALVSVRSRIRWAPATAVIAVAGAVALPLVYLVVLGKAQMEVGVIERAGELLLSTGNPYVVDPRQVSDFNPYLPGMALFGLPSALFGDMAGAGVLVGPRWWFAACFVATMVAAARVAGTGRRTRSAVTLMAVCPAVALPLAIGGVDPPVIGLMCLGLAYAGRGDDGRAGVALGLAAALKWTAWPALPVVFVLLAARRGRRAVLRCAASAAAVLALVCVPVLLTDPRACVQHLVLYPLGLANVPSSAASPLPGHLLATHVPHGTAITLTALGVSAALMGASLLVRPPRTASTAADRIALGLTLAMMLAPATRIGYVIYPLVLFCWFRITGRYAGDEGTAPVRVATACRYGRLLSADRRRGPVRPPCISAAQSECRHARYGQKRTPAGCDCTEHQPSPLRVVRESATSVRTGRRPR